MVFENMVLDVMAGSSSLLNGNGVTALLKIVTFTIGDLRAENVQARWTQDLRRMKWAKTHDINTCQARVDKKRQANMILPIFMYREHAREAGGSDNVSIVITKHWKEPKNCVRAHLASRKAQTEGVPHELHFSQTTHTVGTWSSCLVDFFQVPHTTAGCQTPWPS